jgi:acyl-CoA synthetase (NDP forming)
MTPATAVARAIEDCAADGLQVATVLYAGIAARGHSVSRRLDALAAAATRAGIRVLGPNSLGVVNVPGRMALSANAVFEQETLLPGAVSVISQSGSMLGAIVTRAQARGLGFSKLVSVGNECDLGVGDLVDLQVDDPGTRVILLFLEALRDAPRLAAAARRAFEAGKPIIAYKLGRSTASRELALSHTGAMTSPDDIADAFFHAHGIVRVTVFEALFEAVHFILGQRPSSRRRLAAVTVSGGAAAMVLDSLPPDSVELVPPSDAIITRLAQQNIRISRETVIDLPMGRADGGAYAAVLAALLDSGHCDLVLAVQGSNASYQPESVRDRILAAGQANKPLAVFLGPRAEEAGRILQAHGVAAFHSPESCADAIRAYTAWRAPVSPLVIHEPDRTRIQAAVATAGYGQPNEAGAHRMMHALGIPVAPFHAVKTSTERIDLPFPVAAKILATDIAHKTNIGGVILDIASHAALQQQIDALLQRMTKAYPHTEIDGVLVQTMQRGIAEVSIGFRHDAEIGPVVVLGMGGIYAELMPHRVVRCAPLSLETAMDMIAALPAAALLRGYRGQPAGDINALAGALHSLSLLALAQQPRVLEAEINPLIVKTDGVVAVDALVRLETATG